MRSPIWVKHTGAQIEPLPEGVETVFPRKTKIEVEPPHGPGPLLIGRSTLITLQFPTAQSFDDFRKALVEARCPIQADAALNIIRFPAQYQAQFETVLQGLSETYQTVVQDL